MEWPAARVTGIVFALLGHFGKCFDAWLDSLQDTHETAGGVLLRLAEAAIDKEAVEDDGSQEEFSRNAEEANEQLRYLLDRTLFGWLAIAAIVAILGF